MATKRRRVKFQGPACHRPSHVVAGQGLVPGEVQGGAQGLENEWGVAEGTVIVLGKERTRCKDSQRGQKPTVCVASAWFGLRVVGTCAILPGEGQGSQYKEESWESQREGRLSGVIMEETAREGAGCPLPAGRQERAAQASHQAEKPVSPGPFPSWAQLDALKTETLVNASHPAVEGNC